MASSFVDASIEDQKKLSDAMQQSIKDADKLTAAQKRLLKEYGRIGKNTKELEDEIKLLKLYQELIEKRTGPAKDFNDLLKIQNDLRRTESELLQRELRTQEELYLMGLDKQKVLKESIADQKKASDENSKQLEKKDEEIENENKLFDMGLRTTRDQLKELKKQKETLEATGKDLKNNLAAEKESLKTVTKKSKKEKEALAIKEQEATLDKKKSASLDNIESGTKSFLKTFTGVTDQSNSFVGSLVQSHKLTDDWGAATERIKGVYKGTFNSLNIGLSLLTKIFESTVAFMLEFDKLAASFRKNTGIIDRGFTGIEQRIVNVQRANIRMGVTMDEAFASANALTSGMAQFTSMTDKAQGKVLQTTVLLQEFGVSAGTTSEIFNTFSKGLGYNAQALENLGTEIMAVAESLKIPPQIIATEFNAASKELMKYGGDMMGVFKGLAEQSKQTGLAIGDLMGIVKQFDTFRGAGEAVGKLNAILGGPYLNAINMVYATEEDRVKMMRESIQLSGKVFSDLSRFEQQAIANAAGINDMSQAARLFGGTSSEFANTQMSMKEMQERAAKAQATMDKFKQVMMSFAIALGPLVTALGVFADILLYVMNPVGEFLRLLGVENDAVINLFGGLTVVVYGLAAANAVLGKSFLGLVAGAAPFLIMAGAVTGVFTAIYQVVTALGPVLGIIAGLFATAAAAAAAWWIASTIGAAAIPISAGMAAGTIAITGIIATAAGTVKNLQGFESGKNKGQQVRNGEAIISENGEELVMREDGTSFLVSEPAVIPLGTQDTVYNNADTKAMLSGQGAAGASDSAAAQEAIREDAREAGRIAGEQVMAAAAAELKASSAAQYATAQAMGEINTTLRALAERPIHVDSYLDGKKVFKNQREYLKKDSSFRMV